MLCVCVVSRCLLRVVCCAYCVSCGACFGVLCGFICDVLVAFCVICIMCCVFGVVCLVFCVLLIVLCGS